MTKEHMMINNGELLPLHRVRKVSPMTERDYRSLKQLNSELDPSKFNSKVDIAKQGEFFVTQTLKDFQGQGIKMVQVSGKAYVPSDNIVKARDLNEQDRADFKQRTTRRCLILSNRGLIPLLELFLPMYQRVKSWAACPNRSYHPVKSRLKDQKLVRMKDMTEAAKHCQDQIYSTHLGNQVGVFRYNNVFEGATDSKRQPPRLFPAAKRTSGNLLATNELQSLENSPPLRRDNSWEESSSPIVF